MSLRTTVEHYFRALEAGDSARILELYDADAVVSSPFLGRVKAAEFFPKLTSVTQRSEFNIHQLIVDERLSIVAAHFRYDWWLNDGEKISFECVDLFEAAANGKIIALKIFYDTYPLRSRVGDKYSER